MPLADLPNKSTTLLTLPVQIFVFYLHSTAMPPASRSTSCFHAAREFLHQEPNLIFTQEFTALNGVCYEHCRG